MWWHHSVSQVKVCFVNTSVTVNCIFWSSKERIGDRNQFPLVYNQNSPVWLILSGILCKVTLVTAVSLRHQKKAGNKCAGDCGVLQLQALVRQEWTLKMLGSKLSFYKWENENSKVEWLLVNCRAEARKLAFLILKPLFFHDKNQLSLWSIFFFPPLLIQRGDEKRVTKLTEAFKRSGH